MLLYPLSPRCDRIVRMHLIQAGPPSTEPQRLSGVMNRYGTQMGLPTWVGFLFGIPFILVGVFIFGYALQHPGTAQSELRATGLNQRWLLIWFGSVFPMAGLLVWSMAFRQYRANRRRRAQPAGSPLADFAWDERGAQSRRWPGVIKSFLTAAVITLFLAAFNYLVFTDKSTPAFARIVVLLFDALALWLWIYAARQFLRALKFGNSRIQFDRFPYRTGEPVALRWVPPHSIVEVRGGTFTLRCIRETIVGAGKHRSVLHEQLWAETWRVTGPASLRSGEEVSIQFTPSADCLTTNLSDKTAPVSYWELETKLDLPGLDFVERYLVPVYA